MITVLTSGATLAMLLLWMPSLPSWLRDSGVHRRGPTAFVVNELSRNNELSDATFGSLIHVFGMASQG